MTTFVSPGAGSCRASRPRSDEHVLEHLALCAWIIVPLAVIGLDILPAFRAGRSRVCDITDATPEIDDFEILVPIYGNIRYLENVEYLSQYGSQVVLCTTTEEDEPFNAALDSIACRHGFRIFKTSVPGRKVESGKRSVAAPVRDKVVRDALASVRATYVVCIDADTVTGQPLTKLVGALAANDLDLASVRLLPSNRGSLLARLQVHEYRMAMRMRRVYPWLVSGACHVARTSVHRAVMLRHSLFFQGKRRHPVLIRNTTERRGPGRRWHGRSRTRGCGHGIPR